MYFSVSKPPKSATQTFPCLVDRELTAAAGELAGVASLGSERELVRAGQVEHVDVGVLGVDDVDRVHGSR